MQPPFSLDRVVNDRVCVGGLWFRTASISSKLVPKRGKVLILHGWTERSIMYHRALEFFSTIGYDAMVFDQRGQGETALWNGKDISPREFAYTDMDTMVEHFFGSREQEYEYILYGHSMGAALALLYLHHGEYSHMIDKVVAMCPLVRSCGPFAVLQRWGLWFLDMVVPKMLITPNNGCKDGVTNDANWTKFLEQDDSFFDSAPVRALYNIIQRSRDLEKLVLTGEYRDISTKLLLLQSENDTIVDVRAIQTLYNNLRMEKQYINVKDSGHAIHLELDEVFDLAFDHISQFTT